MRDGSSRVFLDTQARYYSLRLSPDGRYIAATDYPGMLRIWDFRSGQRVKWRAHSDEKKDRPPATIAFMPDGKGLVTGSWDKTLKYWDVSSLDSEVAQEETLDIQCVQCKFRLFSFSLTSNLYFWLSTCRTSFEGSPSRLTDGGSFLPQVISPCVSGIRARAYSSVR